MARVAIGAAVVAWAALVCAGFGVLLRYENRPGVAATAPAHWPAATALARVPGRATLVLALHPRCPCSKATVAELDRLLARLKDRPITVHALFFRPHEAAPAWYETALWRHAAAIPGVDVTVDDDGVEAARFGAATSGQVLLYDAAGTLVFSGGITPSRGHEGDSDGRQAIVDVLSAGRRGPVLIETPVFGCALRDGGRAASGAIHAL